MINKTHTGNKRITSIGFNGKEGSKREKLMRKKNKLGELSFKRNKNFVKKKKN